MSTINIKHVMNKQAIRACKISNNSKQIYQLNTSIYQTYKDMNNISMQDKKYKREERWSITNTGELFRGLSHLLYILTFTATKEFPLKMILQDHSVPQYQQRAPSRTLGPASPSLVPARTTHASKLAEAVTSTTPPNYKVEHLVIYLITNKHSHNKDPRGWI